MSYLTLVCIFSFSSGVTTTTASTSSHGGSNGESVGSTVSGGEVSETDTHSATAPGSHDGSTPTHGTGSNEGGSNGTSTSETGSSGSQSMSAPAPTITTYEGSGSVVKRSKIAGVAMVLAMTFIL